MASKVDDCKEPLLGKEENDDKKDPSQPQTMEFTLTEGPKDPTTFKKISIGGDYYSLTWACLKVKLFENKTLRGEKIYLLPQDYFNLYFEFVFFIIMLALTIILVVRNVVLDDVYKEGSLSIILCRIILMIFAMKSLGPEFNTGYAKYLCALKRRKMFTYPGFAQFVGLCQIINASIALFGILFFVCTADEFGELLTNFSGLCILTELDDWIGDMIITNKLQDDDYPEDDKDDDEETLADKAERRMRTEERRKNNFDLKDLNERLSVVQKMAMIEDEDLNIYVNETLTENAHWTVVWVDSINKIIPWQFIVPILTLPISYLMPYITERIRKWHGYEN